MEEFCERNPIDKPQAVAKKEVWVHAGEAMLLFGLVVSAIFG